MVSSHFRLAVDIGAGSIKLPIPLPLPGIATAIPLITGTTTAQRQYSGTFDCMRVTYRTEGLRGVYAGLAISLTGSVIFRGMFMGGYDIVKYLYDLEHSSVPVRLFAAHVSVVCGVLCSVLCALCAM